MHLSNACKIIAKQEMKEEKVIINTVSKHEVEEEQQELQIQNRKTSVWTKEKISQLIEQYKKHECLWNHWHEAYRSKDKRKRAIADICHTLNVTKFEFGRKIHNLRNQFNTEMKKLEQRIEEAGVNLDDSSNTEFRCKWSHFKSLLFLRHVIEPRPGGYQNNYQPQKKIRIKFDFNSSEDDMNISSGMTSSNMTNPEDMSQIQYDDNENEEVITDDFQPYENETIEVNKSSCSQEICDQKYHPPPSTKSKKSLQHTPTSSACSSSQTDNTSINEDSSILELNSTGLATPIISSITSNAPNRSTSILRDQWDAFGELVANEFRNLHSEISRKRLKRKIMQAMLEVGDQDDALMTSRSSSK